MLLMIVFFKKNIYSYVDNDPYPKTYTSTDFTSVNLDFNKDFEIRLSYTRSQESWTDVINIRKIITLTPIIFLISNSGSAVQTKKEVISLMI